jgi:hypothetical protein
MRVMREFSDGYIGFTQGSFDEWAVVVKVAGFPEWPKDSWYFTKLAEYAQELGEVVYKDFVTLYEVTTKEALEVIFDLISGIAARYPKPKEAEVIFCILYMTMIAEENKDGAILKKRIKRLGVHQILVEGMAPELAANYSRGKKSEELVMECHLRGF